MSSAAPCTSTSRQADRGRVTPARQDRIGDLGWAAQGDWSPSRRGPRPAPGTAACGPPGFRQGQGYLLVRRLMRRHPLAALLRQSVVSTSRTEQNLRQARTASRTRLSILITRFRAVRAAICRWPSNLSPLSGGYENRVTRRGPLGQDLDGAGGDPAVVPRQCGESTEQAPPVLLHREHACLILGFAGKYWNSVASPHG